MAKYSLEFKESIQRRMMPPDNMTINALTHETGISEVTLHQWRKQARASGLATPGDGRQSERWSSEDKFLIVVETSTLSEVELADYCRHKGLFVEQVRSWQDICRQANGGLAQETARLHRELRDEKKRNRSLAKDLNRKDRALAETSALLVLRKKAQAIWGDGEDS